MIKKLTSTILCLGALAYAGSSNSQLATKLTNPVADMISVPFQFNYATGMGGHDGSQTLLNFQPVIPFHLNEDWNLITRMVMPIIAQSDVTALNESQTFIGDSLFSFFLSPVKPIDGWIVGVGLAVNAPTSTDHSAAPAEWSVGPTAVLLHMKDGLTVGMLASSLFSVSGTDDNEEVKATYVQPFIAYTTASSITYSLDAEATYDWVTSKTDIPLNLIVGKLFRIGELPISVSGGLKYWAQSEISQTDKFGLRASITFILPE